METIHVKSLRCEVCEFGGKTESGLKTHVRTKHTKRIKYCDWCSFGSSKENEIDEHVNKFEFSHTNDWKYLSDNKQQVKIEIAEMKEMGFLFCSTAIAYKMFRNNHSFEERTFYKHVICFWFNPFVVYIFLLNCNTIFQN